MATMTVSLPDPMKDWIEAQVRNGTYSSASDYVRDLVRRDREHRDREARDRTYTIEELRSLLAEARASGASGLSVADIRETGRRIAEANGWLDERG